MSDLISLQLPQHLLLQILVVVVEFSHSTREMKLKP